MSPVVESSVYSRRLHTRVGNSNGVRGTADERFARGLSV